MGWIERWVEWMIKGLDAPMLAQDRPHVTSDWEPGELEALSQMYRCR